MISKTIKLRYNKEFWRFRSGFCIFLNLEIARSCQMGRDLISYHASIVFWRATVLRALHTLSLTVT